MRYFLVFIGLFFTVKSLTNKDYWEEFKHDHGKRYMTSDEDHYRFSVFQSSLKKIKQHNEKYQNGEESYFLRTNQFADLTDEEFSDKFLGYSTAETRPNIEYIDPKVDPVPESIDWKEKGAVLSVKEQGECAAGWAFSVAGAIEGHTIIQYKIAKHVSAQQFIDCSIFNHACAGGYPMNVYSEFMSEKIFSESSYPYTAKNGTCKTGTDMHIRIKRYVGLIQTEQVLKNVVGTRGPVSVGINGNDIKLYGGGIFNNKNCSQKINHYVLAVGYGTISNTAYWTLKNSWGTKWGQEGYMQLARNSNSQCGIGFDSSYPIILKI